MKNNKDDVFESYNDILNYLKNNRIIKSLDLYYAYKLENGKVMEKFYGDEYDCNNEWEESTDDLEYFCVNFKNYIKG